MTTQEPLQGGAVLAGGRDGTDLRPDPIVDRRSAAVQESGGTAVDLWRPWARAQLVSAVAVAGRVPAGGSVAGALYRDWFNPVVEGIDLMRSRRPLAGLYRNAHVGSGVEVARDGLSVVDRHDVVGADGWWRTWGESWTPPRSRPGSVRVLFSPRPDRLAEFVRVVTSALVYSSASWSLGCATSPRRVRRYASAVLDLPGLEAMPAQLLGDLEFTLRPVVPPLCLPIAAGAAMAAYPDNGMTFGEHRCHLIALALRDPSSADDPLRAIAAVFTAHGINPATPYRAG